ncbi:hypothetical protein PHISCL_09596 [Aspergillus sclerotialis]|uniref:BTB domain-containing protein n=1 Tax=Aspergillus sclerotialis TaxID=2070753 RepID=A0A3A2ZLN5_9EURO|nr:hypothetical protein PHISCL_09596 [Aspergillus sclerotialis]
MLSTKRQPHPHLDTFSKYRAGKSSSRPKRPTPPSSRRVERRQKPDSPPDGKSVHPELQSVVRYQQANPNKTTSLISPSVVTLSVGPSQRLFAAHEAILCASPFFAAYCRNHPDLNGTAKRISLPDEQPEILSCILEFLYRGDYYPHLIYNKRRNTWELEDTGVDADGQSNEATIFHPGAGAMILKDTAVYCAAEKYAIEPLKRLALRKQGLHSGIQCSTILTSARYAYANTPDTESKLRAHYLALIIRSRSTFKRSGTMQMEMERGGKLFFDLFVAMCNHMDDIVAPGELSLGD